MTVALCIALALVWALGVMPTHMMVEAQRPVSATYSTRYFIGVALWPVVMLAATAGALWDAVRSTK